MLLLKRLTFAPFFIIMSALMFWHLEPLISDPNYLLSTDLSHYTQTAVLVTLLLASAFFYVLFVSTAQSLKLVLPTVIISCLTSLIFFPNSYGIVLALGSAFLLCLVSLHLIHNLHDYLIFKPVTVLSGSAQLFMIVIMIVSTISLFMVSVDRVKQKGVELPDFIVDLPIFIIKNVCSLSPESQGAVSSLDSLSSMISPEAIELLKNNPETLKQFGVDPSLLDSITNSPAATNKNSQSSVSSQLNREVIRKTLQGFLNPYKDYIPYFLSISYLMLVLPLCLFFIFLIYLPLIITFWILEKSGFTHYEIETREVKKLMV